LTLEQAINGEQFNAMLDALKTQKAKNE